MNIIKSIITFFTQSSEDPAKTSATLTGLLIALSAQVQQLAVFVPGISTFYASPLGQQLDVILTGVGTIVGTGIFLFGLFRKVTNKAESVAGLRVE